MAPADPDALFAPPVGLVSGLTNLPRRRAFPSGSPTLKGLLKNPSSLGIVHHRNDDDLRVEAA